MATWALQTVRSSPYRASMERWFSPAIGAIVLALAIAGFAPAIVHPAARRGPVSLLAAAHGIVFFAWLVLFLVQSLLVSTRHVPLHRRLGLTGAGLLALMIPLGYVATVGMVRRGFDLSGDQHIDADPLYYSVFSFGTLALFALLAITGLVLRRRPEIHKRLMLFANITLVQAPVAHILGHSPALSAHLSPSVVLIPIAILLLCVVAKEFVVRGRPHPLTWKLALAIFLSLPLMAGAIGPSAAWHHLAERLTAR
ncbi:MAG: hypothetical protein NVS9B15_16640 [Acidobacteriaceae bacterium]